MSFVATCVEDVARFVRESSSVLPRVGETRTGLHAPVAAQEQTASSEGDLSLAGLSGVIEHLPEEYTVTVRAGTPLKDLVALLAEAGQYLPFEPPLVESGGSVAGAVASGMSGSGRIRFGGVRDFILGVTFIDGLGRCVRGGGKVVKNAAGFDLPKLFVGSLGSLGVLVDVTFKVFPRAPAEATLLVTGSAASLRGVYRALATSALDLDALELEATVGQGEPHAAEMDSRLALRVAGPEAALEERLHRARTAILSAVESTDRGVEQALDVKQASAAESAEVWRRQCELTWRPGGTSLFKVPTTLAQSLALDRVLEDSGFSRCLGHGGRQLLVAAPPHKLESLGAELRRRELRGLCLLAEHGTPSRFIGVPWEECPERAFAERTQRALDPRSVFRPSWA